MKNVISYYKNLSELNNELDKDTYKDWSDHEETIDKRTSSHQKKWAGALLPEARQMLANGWAEGAAKIKAAGKIVARDSESRGTPRLKSAVIGCVPNVPAYLMGVPKQMLRIDTLHRHKPVIDVYVSAVINAGIDVDELTRSAAKVAGIVTAIEKTGVRVNLFVVEGIENNEETNSWCVVTKIKDSRAPLNLLNIAFPLTHRAFTRSIFLRWEETHIKTHMWGYGRVMKECELKREYPQLKGLFYSLIDITEQKTPLEQLVRQANDYLAGKAK